MLFKNHDILYENRTSRIFLKAILSSKQPSKVNFGTSKLISQLFDPMPPIHQKGPAQLDLNTSKNQGSWKYWKQPILRTSHPGSHLIKPVKWTAILAATQSNQELDSHPGSHSIKPVDWTAILEVTQSNHSTGQLSWQSIRPVDGTAILAATQSNQSTGQPCLQSLNQT